MKISIDTSADSKEEIRKAIKLLLSIVEQDSAQRDIFASASPEVYSAATPSPEPSQTASAFGSMFGDDAPAPSAPDDIPKEKKINPKVELY